jgi:hypothetical protein
VAIFEFRYFDVRTAVFHLIFDLVAAAFLIAAFFAGFNKVPFTCSYSTNKMQLAALATAYLFGFTIYVQIAGGLKRSVTQSPLRMAVFLAIAGLVYSVLRKRARRKEIVYKDDGPGFLSLTDDSGYWTQTIPLLRGGGAAPFK